MLPGEQFATVVQASRLLWPDSVTKEPNDAIYVTASHIPQMLAWQGLGVARAQWFCFRPG